MRNAFFLTVVGFCTILLSACQQQPTTEYRVAGRVDFENGADIKAVLSYTLHDGSRHREESEIIDNRFKFNGTVEEPNRAFLSFSGMPQDPEKRHANIIFYLEPGKTVKMTIDTDLVATKIVGADVNADFSRWNKSTAELEDRREALFSGDGTPNVDQESLMKEFNAIEIKGHGMALDFIKKNPGSYFALETLYERVVGHTSQDVKHAEEVFMLFTPELRSTKLGEATQTKVNNWKATAIGEVAPDFTLETADGENVTLSQFRGKYVFIDFWATWCYPCVDQIPMIVAAERELRDKGLAVLTITEDRNNEKGLEAWKQGIERLEMEDLTNTMNNWGAEDEVVKVYGIRSIPSNLLIDPQGVIIAKRLHAVDAEELIDKLLEYIK